MIGPGQQATIAERQASAWDRYDAAYTATWAATDPADFASEEARHAHCVRLADDARMGR